MELKNYVKKGQIIFCDETVSKEEAISVLCSSLSETYGLDLKTIEDAVFDREKKLTTGIGGSVAIPHARIEGIDNFYVAMMICRKSIDFSSLDGEPVKIVTLLLSPCRMVKEHIALISRISYFLTEPETHDQLLKAETVEEVAVLAQKF